MDVPVFLPTMQELRDQGEKLRDIAKRFGVSYRCVQTNTSGPTQADKDKLNADILAMRKSGVCAADVAAHFGVNERYVYKYAKTRKRSRVTVDYDDIPLMQDLRDDGISVKDIADKFEYSVYTVNKFTLSKEQNK